MHYSRISAAEAVQSFTTNLNIVGFYGSSGCWVPTLEYCVIELYPTIQRHVLEVRFTTFSMLSGLFSLSFFFSSFSFHCFPLEPLPPEILNRGGWLSITRSVCGCLSRPLTVASWAATKLVFAPAGALPGCTQSGRRQSTAP